jgi:hypothetical protein
MRYFTRDEANEALGRVRPLAELLVELGAEIAERRRELASLQASAAGNGEGARLRARASELEALLEADARRLSGVVAEIEALGAQVKDVLIGLVDFPSVRGGEPVLLCWRVGEPAITHWHGLDEGFAGRKPLDP